MKQAKKIENHPQWDISDDEEKEMEDEDTDTDDSCESDDE